MEPTDLTIQILREIRDEIGKTNARLDQTIARLDQTNARLDQTREDLASRQDQTSARLVESEIRMSTAITGLAGTLEDIKHLLSDRLEVRDRVEHCEREIEAIKVRLA